MLGGDVHSCCALIYIRAFILSEDRGHLNSMLKNGMPFVETNGMPSDETNGMFSDGANDKGILLQKVISVHLLCCLFEVSSLTLFKRSFSFPCLHGCGD